MLNTPGRLLHAGHYIGWRNGNGYVIVFALLSTTDAVGMITAHGHTMIDHLHFVTFCFVWLERIAVVLRLSVVKILAKVKADTTYLPADERNGMSDDCTWSD